MMPLFERRQLQRGDVTIAYESYGSGPTTVLLVMGLGIPAGGWGDELPSTLARDHRVLAIDNRGTGRSSKPHGPYSLAEMARDAVAILDAEGTERAHVVGISMGGMIAQLVALDDRDRLDRLVLMSTHGGGADVVSPERGAASALTSSVGLPADILRTRFSMLTADGFAARHPEAIESFVELLLAVPTPPYAFFAQLAALMASDRSRRLIDVEAPTLVVHGDADRLIPLANGAVLARTIPGARLRVLSGVGHMPMWEAPALTAELIADFLRPRA